jgi:hypothetical protein
LQRGAVTVVAAVTFAVETVVSRHSEPEGAAAATVG